MRQSKNSFKTLVVFAVFAVFSTLLSMPVAAQDTFPADSSIHAMLKELVVNPQTSGIIVGLVETDGSQLVIAYGSEGPERNPLNKNSVIEIGSITKVFTGVLLADMTRRGEVELTDPLTLLLPSVHVPSRNGKEITLLDLATHTSGLPVMPSNFPEPENAEAYTHYTVQQMYDFLSSYELPRDPGKKVEYSNFLSLLGHALAQRAGKPYEVLLHERILVPLEMQHTAITLTPEMKHNMTQGSSRYGNSVPYFVAPAFAASGGLKSTINDMLDFAAANLSKDSTGIYSSLRFARQPQRQIDGTSDFFGLGWGADSLGQIVGHSGGTFGYNSYIYIDSEKRRALIVLENTAGNTANKLGVHLLEPNKFVRPKPSVGREVATVYLRAGTEQAIARFHDLHESAQNRWNFDESELNSVGYWMLAQDAVDDAIAIFQLNVTMYSESPNPYDSLGDAYSVGGKIEEAVRSYQKAVALAESADHPNLDYFRKNLEKANQQLTQQK